jgi:DNA-binding transcriptional ArsR family regulator
MDVFTALAEPTRRTIVEMLAKNGELSAMEIGSKFNSSPPAISQHLKVLREARIVKVEKKGRQRIYTMDPSALKEFEAWTEKMKIMWNDRFDRLDEVLKTLKK